MGYSFLPPKKFKATSQSVCCTSNLRGINWNSGHEKYTGLEKILKKLKAPETEFFAKGHENARFYQSFWKQRILILMTTLAQSSVFDFRR